MGRKESNQTNKHDILFFDYLIRAGILITVRLKDATKTLPTQYYDCQ